MLVQVNTDNHIKGGEELARRVEAEVEGTLVRFGEQITRVEVHLHDENGPKGGDRDLRCLMEARVAGHQPVAVSCAAASLDDAVAGAVDKLEKALDHLFDKLTNHKGRTSFGGDQAI